MPDVSDSSEHDPATCQFGHIDGMCAGKAFGFIDQSDEPTEDFVIWDDIAWFTPTEAQAEIIKHVVKNYETKARGNYTSMVHRETDGPDPLVQEPKDKP